MLRGSSIRPLAALLIAVFLLDLGAFALHSEEGHEHGEPCALGKIFAEPAAVDAAPAPSAAPEPSIADAPTIPEVRLEAVDLHPWNARSPPALPAI